jgi:cytochrome P450
LGAINPSASDSFVAEPSGVQPNDLVHCTRDMLNTIQDYIYVPLPSNFFKIAKTPGIKRLDSSVDKLKLLGDKLMTRFLTKDKTSIEANMIKNQSDKCLASSLAINYPEMDKENMQALLMDLLGAGHDTTANLITFTIGSLLTEDAQQQKWYKDLLLEIEVTIIGNRCNFQGNFSYFGSRQ